MFKFLKDKITEAISKVTKKAEETSQNIEETKEPEKTEEKIEIEVKTEEKERTEEKKEEAKKEKEEKIEEKKVTKEYELEEKIQKKEEAIKKEQKIEKEEVKEEKKKGFFEKITEKVTTTKISEEKFEEIFWDLELALMENNVAIEAIDKIKKDLKKSLVDKPLKRSDLKNIVLKSLKESINELLNQPSIDIVEEIKKSEKPYAIVFVGVNGSGKTTSISKFAQHLKDNKISSVIAAADTFRAAAIHQLEEHGKKLGIKVIKHDYGSDPAAVAFDAEKYAKAHNIDVVLIDTAGRMHSNTNLLEEMKKIIRVAKPNLKIFVGEAITGNDCVEQARKFNEAINIDGVILAKADIDEKGGAAISASYVTGKPILFMGVGQEYKDLERFDKEKIIKNIGL